MDSDRVSSEFQHYAEALEWIYGLIALHDIKPGLKRMECLMERLDHPHRRLKFIHVAGTNGKGSTCSYLARTLLECGYSVGIFTSPYIEKFTNRIQCDGQDIPEEELLRLTNEVKPIADEIALTELGSPSMFEVVTTIAILYFARTAYPDYVVWETGLGGRLDSTNIVTPIVSVITNIGHDHMDILGSSLEEIAFEKAGIIKPGVPVVSAVEQPELAEIITQVSARNKSTCYLLNRQFTYETVSSELNNQVFHFEGPFRKLSNLAISLNGQHQLKNAAAAIMVLEVLRQYYAAIIGDEDLLKALKATFWPGRLEMVSDSPRILLDGAHNPEGAETLAAALKLSYRYNKLHIMIAMLSTKVHNDYLRHILPIADTLIITEPDFMKKMSADKLYTIAEDLLSQGSSRHHVNLIVEPDWKTALYRLTEMTDIDDMAVITGTLYLISDARSWILHQTDSEKGW